MLSKKWFLVSTFVIQQLIAAHHPAYVLLENSATPVPKQYEMEEVDAQKTALSTVCSCCGFLCSVVPAEEDAEKEYIEIAEPQISIMPIAANAVVIASFFKLHHENMASSVFLSTIFALIYLPLLVLLVFPLL